jgi:hypothetical protein
MKNEFIPEKWKGAKTKVFAEDGTFKIIPSTAKPFNENGVIVYYIDGVEVARGNHAETSLTKWNHLI